MTGSTPVSQEDNSEARAWLVLTVQASGSGITMRGMFSLQTKAMHSLCP